MAEKKLEKQLSVRLHGEPLGILSQKSNGKMSFFYHENATKIISLSMPLQEKPYDHLKCEAFFGGLLPESESAKKALGKKYGVSHNNSFSLLQAIGYDCAGAISCHEINSPVIEDKACPLEGQLISPDVLYAQIKTLPKQPLFSGFEDLRLSLAGVQDKAAVCLIDNQIALPIHGCPTTHILKPTNPHFEGLVENEFFCLSLANAVGLSIPEISLKHLKDISYLLIQRYDRAITDKTIQRIHQEDFCQALSIISTRKYQNEGGPGFTQCFNLIDQTSTPAKARDQLINMIIFNFLIGNMDAHGKNFSLLHSDTPSNQINLTPFYDLVCTRFFPDLSRKMAMKIGGEYQADKVELKDWEKFCELINYSFPAFKKLIQKQSELILKIIDTQIKNYAELSRHPAIIEKIGELIRQNIETHTRCSTFPMIQAAGN